MNAFSAFGWYLVYRTPDYQRLKRHIEKLAKERESFAVQGRSVRVSCVAYKAVVCTGIAQCWVQAHEDI